jgi:phage terminase large subunit-like protein
MNPDDNIENISEEYIKELSNLPRRKKKRFLDGEFADDSEGALWDDDMINRNRVKEPPPMKRIVIAVDPAVTSRDDSDETGIIVCGASFNNHFYILEDQTGTYTPTEWAEKVVFLFKKWQADRVVAEVNNGGDLVETVLRTIDKTIPYHGVHATRDKLTRAEPVSALWEQNLAHHVGEFTELELEMTSWEAKKGEKSPNRIDATVWGANELALVDFWDFIVT